MPQQFDHPLPDTPSPPTPHRIAWLMAALAIAVFALYSRIIGNDFLNFDDPEYITSNTQVLKGLSLENLHWAFVSSREYYWWHPLTWLAHMFNCEIWGSNAAGHHAFSVAIHGLNASLLFLLLQRLTKQTKISLVAAAIFSMHPLRVESVAWASEVKDVLSFLFLLATIHGYISYARDTSRTRYLLVSALFLLGLLSKPVICILPCALMMLDIWPLQRLPPWHGRTGGLRSWFGTLSRLVLEKIPWLLLGAGIFLFAASGKVVTNAIVSNHDLTGMMRLAHVAVAYWKYLGMMLWPVGLAGYYSYDLPSSASIPCIAGLALLLVTGWSFVLWRRHPWFICGWLWYLGTMVPLIGFIQVFDQDVADRFTLVPMLGILFIGVGWAVQLQERFALRSVSTHEATRLRVISACLLWLFIISLTANTWYQIGFWHDSVIFWRRVITINANRPYSRAHYNLALALQEKGNTNEAISQYETAIRINPNYGDAYNNLGDLFSRNKQHEQAIRCFSAGVRLKPDYIPVRNNLAIEFATVQRYTEAEAQFQEILNRNQIDINTWLNLARLYKLQNRQSDESACYLQVIKIAQDTGNNKLAEAATKQLKASAASIP